MKINTKFTVAVHILTLLELNKNNPATSEMMAKSVGTHPVFVRQIMSALKKSGLIETQSGIPGGKLTKPQDKISLYEVYRAVKQKTDTSLFDMHSKPNRICPVGRNIKEALEAPINDAQAAMENVLKGYSLKDITSFIIENEQQFLYGYIPEENI